MSSPFEHKVTYVVAGAGEDPGIRDLLAAGSLKPELLHLTGEPGDGRRLLAAIASSDRVVYSPWPASNG
jgi:hypothetical protein